MIQRHVTKLAVSHGDSEVLPHHVEMPYAVALAKFAPEGCRKEGAPLPGRYVLTCDRLADGRAMDEAEHVLVEDEHQMSLLREIVGFALTGARVVTHECHHNPEAHRRRLAALERLALAVGARSEARANPEGPFRR